MDMPIEIFYDEAFKMPESPLAKAIKKQKKEIVLEKISALQTVCNNAIEEENVLYLSCESDTRRKNTIIFIDERQLFEAAYLGMVILDVYQNKWLSQVMETSMKFNEITLNNPDIVLMVNYFNEIMKNPVIIYDEFFNITAATADYLSEYDRDENELLQCELRNLYYYKQRVILKSIKAPKRECNRLLFPVIMAGMPKGYLAIFDIDTPYEKMDMTVLATFANSALVEMQRRLELGSVESKFISNFLYDIIYRKEDKIEEIYRRAKILGLEENAHYVMITINPCGYLNNLRFDTNGYITQYEFMNDRIMNTIDNYHRKNYQQDIVTKFDTSIYILHKINQHKENEGKDNYAYICHKMLKMLNEQFDGMVFQIGIGDVACGIEQISNSYKQAWYAISYGKMVNGDKNDFVVGYNDNSFLKLFSRLQETDSVDELIPQELLKVINYDEHNNNQLYNTLKIYLDCNCNAKKAAEKLYIHYKTMLYRLEKLRNEFGIDLGNSTARVYVELGIQLLEITKERKH